MFKYRRPRQISLTFLLSALAVIGLGCYSQTSNAPPQVAANKKWAEEINLPGVPNFHKVSENLYRGAQPTNEGFEQLEKLGVKTVVNLRSFHSDRDELKNVNLNYEHIHMMAWHMENKDAVNMFQRK